MNKDNKNNSNRSSSEKRVLMIKSIPPQEFERESRKRMKQAMDGKSVPHVINFEDPKKLRKILTEKRLELIEQIQRLTPESIRDLARKLNRGLREIHEDLQLLKEYDIVRFDEDGRSKRPVIPYDEIEIEARLINQPEYETR